MSLTLITGLRVSSKIMYSVDIPKLKLLLFNVIFSDAFEIIFIAIFSDKFERVIFKSKLFAFHNAFCMVLCFNSDGVFLFNVHRDT